MASEVRRQCSARPGDHAISRVSLVKMGGRERDVVVGGDDEGVVQRAAMNAALRRRAVRVALHKFKAA